MTDWPDTPRIIITQEDDGRYIAETDGSLGWAGAGATPEEALEQLRKTIIRNLMNGVTE